MIETKEQYSNVLEQMNQRGLGGSAAATHETIEALREVARAANAMNEADQMDEGVIFFDRVLPALDALPDWITEDG